jgi:hypothetical protein
MFMQKQNRANHSVWGLSALNTLKKCNSSKIELALFSDLRKITGSENPEGHTKVCF